MAKNKTIEFELDPLHPLSRRIMRRLQLFAKRAIERCRRQGGLPPRLALLAEAAGIVGETATHLARAIPRHEYDEQAQQLLAFDGAPIGRLKRPAAFRDQLLPIFEAAIMAQFDGHQVEGDVDQVNECAPADCAGLVEVES